MTSPFRGSAIGDNLMASTASEADFAVSDKTSDIKKEENGGENRFSTTISIEDDPQQNPFPDVSTVWEVLSNERRRLIILVLAEYGRDYDGLGPYFSLGDIADILVEASRDSPSRKSVYVSIIQCHADKLEEAGVIQYNNQETKIRPKLLLYKLESVVLEMERSMSEF